MGLYKKPIPMLLWCPNGHRHIDAGAFAEKPHATHACQTCGVTWKPSLENTVGVQFLPGYKDTPDCPDHYHYTGGAQLYTSCGRLCKSSLVTTSVELVTCPKCRFKAAQKLPGAEPMHYVAGEGCDLPCGRDRFTSFITTDRDLVTCVICLSKLPKMRTMTDVAQEVPARPRLWGSSLVEVRLREDGQVEHVFEVEGWRLTVSEVTHLTGMAIAYPGSHYPPDVGAKHQTFAELTRVQTCVRLEKFPRVPYNHWTMDFWTAAEMSCPRCYLYNRFCECK